MKKIIVGVVGLVLLFSVVAFADDIVEIFSFDLLKDKVVENSLSLESSKLNLESKELNLEEVNKDAINADQMGGNRVTYINNRIKVESDTLIAKMNVVLAEQSLLKEEEELKDNIYKKGMEYLLISDEIILNEKILEFKKRYEEFTEKRVESGISTSTDLINKTINVQSQEMKLLELAASFDAITIEINHLIGNDLSYDLNIEDSLEIFNFITYDIEKIYLDRVDSYSSVYTKSETLKSKEIIFDLYASKYVETDKEYKIALYNKQIAEIEYEDAKKSFEVSLRSSYNNYLNMHDSYLLSLKQNELSSKLYDEAKLKYDLGLLSTEDLLNVEESKLNSDFLLKRAIYNYNISKIDFENLY